MSEKHQENIADRVTTYVRKHMFRVVKFISNEHMFVAQGISARGTTAARDPTSRTTTKERRRQQGKVQEEREKGKYTAQKTGHCKYGGWSREGMARYNEFYHLVKADRTCEQAMDMERELLNHCIALKRRGTNGEGSRDTSDGEQAEALEPVEACWDLE
ncbi:hypothetical protein MHU86_5566 [Fragilaria crotonensis]|nr:hypothetical protein MHU86_5566 [Fragilaria crotonensis]